MSSALETALRSQLRTAHASPHPPRYVRRGWTEVRSDVTCRQSCELVDDIPCIIGDVDEVEGVTAPPILVSADDLELMTEVRAAQVQKRVKSYAGAPWPPLARRA